MQAEGTAPERKYALTKIKPGDYLLPSNDGRIIWRFTTYEDGPSHGLDAPRDRKFWGAWRWIGECNFVDTSDGAWDRWELTHTLCETRAEAIREVMRCG